MAKVYTGRSGSWHEDYDRGRPGWPPEVVDVPGVAPEASVLELGAGTGKLTGLLVSTFERVIAVEPDEGMRRLLESRCPEARVVDGSAHAIPLADASVDAAFVAEAFHLFSDERAVAELARVLRPGGALVLLWNLPAGTAEPALAAAEALLLERAPSRDELGYDPVDLNTTRYESGEWRLAFADSPFEDFQEACFPNPENVDREGVLAFLASMGWLSDLPDDERRPLLDEVRSTLVDEEYRRLWETRVHWARREA